jgi:4-oxalocrotonate tautomerase
MPHVIVKMYPGRSEQQKAKLAEEITKAVMLGANCGEPAVSVSIEEVSQADWVEQVFKPDIIAQPDRVYKKPGYNPL